MTKDQRIYGGFDNDTRRYIAYMCKKDCKYYDEEKSCLKERSVRYCARKGLKNKE